MKLLTIAALALALGISPAIATAGPKDGARPFAGMSEPGRRALLQSMAATGDADRADRERVKAARDRMMALLAADRLDNPALRRAMDEERAASNAMRVRRQTALLQTMQGLSLADRRAFVADARNMRGRIESRFPRLQKHRERSGGGGDLPDLMQPL